MELWSFLFANSWVVILSVQVFRGIGWTIVVLSVVRVGLEFTATEFKAIFRNHLVSSLDCRRDIVVSIGTTANEVASGDYVISWVWDGLLPCFSLGFDVIRAIAWVGVKDSSVYLKLSFRLEHFLPLQRVLNIVACVSSWVIKFTLSKDLVIRMHNLLRLPWQPFIIVVECIVGGSIELSTHLKLLLLLDQLGWGEMFGIDIVALIGGIWLELSFGHYLIVLELNLLSLCYISIPLVVLLSVGRVPLEFASNSQLAFFLYRPGNLGWIGKIVSCVCTCVIEFPLGEDFIIGKYNLLLPWWDSFIGIVVSIVGWPFELAS